MSVAPKLKEVLEILNENIGKGCLLNIDGKSFLCGILEDEDSEKYIVGCKLTDATSHEVYYARFKVYKNNRDTLWEMEMHDGTNS